jgi:transposase-like protein
LDEDCQKLGKETTSVASIWRIIRELNDKSCNLSEERIGKYKPDKFGNLLQSDSVHLRIDGKKHYLINAVDVKSRLAFSKEYDRLNSTNAEDFLKLLRIETANGSEFDGYAHKYLKNTN